MSEFLKSELVISKLEYRRRLPLPTTNLNLEHPGLSPHLANFAATGRVPPAKPLTRPPDPIPRQLVQRRSTSPSAEGTRCPAPPIPPPASNGPESAILSTPSFSGGYPSLQPPAVRQSPASFSSSNRLGAPSSASDDDESLWRTDPVFFCR